jgi:hypothetical protein
MHTIMDAERDAILDYLDRLTQERGGRRTWPPCPPQPPAWFTSTPATPQRGPGTPGPTTTCSSSTAADGRAPGCGSRRRWPWPVRGAPGHRLKEGTRRAAGEAEASAACRADPARERTDYLLTSGACCRCGRNRFSCQIRDLSARRGDNGHLGTKVKIVDGRCHVLVRRWRRRA